MMASNAVTCGSSGWLYYVLIVWVAVATVCIQINAHSQIPSSVLYAMKQVKTIEDLLELLDQTGREVKPTQAKHIPWIPPQDKDDWDEDDDDEDDESDEDDHRPRSKPRSEGFAELAAQMRLKLISTQFSTRDASRRFVQELFRALDYQSSQGFTLNDVAELPQCIPREALITVPSEPNEPNVIYWPGCVTVKRCGGCCSNELFECQATESEIVQRKVVKMEYNPKLASNFQYGGIVAKNITQDRNCSCQCKVKSQDCDPATQIYHNCQCKCKEWVTCPPKKYWDPIRCQCACSASQTERICSRLRQTWNKDSCSCTCRKDLMARCRPPHQFNNNRCKCERRSTRSTKNS